MLVLSRKVGERIIIGDGVEVTILAIKGGQIRLGINASPDIHIRRAELAPLSESERGLRKAAEAPDEGSHQETESTARITAHPVHGNAPPRGRLRSVGDRVRERRSERGRAGMTAIYG